MHLQTLKNTLEDFAHKKFTYAYHSDEYSRFLLRQKIRKPTRLSELKSTPFRHHLDRPNLKDRLRGSGDGKIHPQQLHRWASPSNEENLWFNLSLGKWGCHNHLCSYHQTSRGGWNLVLRLNFSSQHNHPFSRLLGLDARDSFEFDSHPIDQKGLTLAWTRIDYDPKSKEVLVEEIQSDWVREVRSDLEHLEELDHATRRELTDHHHWNGDQLLLRLKRYHDQLLNPYRKQWKDAMLTSTLWFLVKKMGFRKVFFHSHESQAAYKDFGYRQHPPRSLYRDLPLRFGFKATHDRPSFLKWDRRIEERSSHRRQRGSSQILKKIEEEELAKSKTPMYVLNF
jgi:hypothetical protein